MTTYKLLANVQTAQRVTEGRV